MPRLETDVLADVDLLMARRRHLDVVLALSLAQRDLWAPRRPEAWTRCTTPLSATLPASRTIADLIRPHEQAGEPIRQALRIEVELASGEAAPASMVTGTMELLANLGVALARQHSTEKKNSSL